jgi:hypothetical protein
LVRGLFGEPAAARSRLNLPDKEHGARADLNLVAIVKSAFFERACRSHTCRCGWPVPDAISILYHLHQAVRARDSRLVNHQRVGFIAAIDSSFESGVRMAPLIGLGDADQRWPPNALWQRDVARRYLHPVRSIPFRHPRVVDSRVQAVARVTRLIQ